MAEKPSDSPSKDDDVKKRSERDLPFQLRDVTLSTQSSAMRPPTGPVLRSRSSRASGEDDSCVIRLGPVSRPGSSSQPQSPSREHHLGHTAPTSRVSSCESLPSSSMMSSPSKMKRKDKHFSQSSLFAPKVEVHTTSTDSGSRLMGSSTTTWSSTYGGSTSPYSSKSPSARTLSDVSSSIFDSSVTTHSSSSTLPSPLYDSSSASAQSGSDSESASSRSRSTASLPTTTAKSHRRKTSSEPRKRRYSQSMSNIQSPPKKE